MRSVVRIVSTPGPNGRSHHSIATQGQHLALRRTGADVLHLVGTVAGPLGGDEIEIDLHVHSGASLTLLSAAATIVLPHRLRPDSTWSVTAVVEDGASLTYAPEPVVVVAGAEHTATTSLTLAGDAVAHVRETVVLGRSGEPGGTWTGRISATRDGLTLLRQTQRSEWLLRDGDRALVSDLRLVPLAAEAKPEAATSGRAVALPLAAGGTLVTAVGADVSSATADAAAVLLPRIPTGG